MGTKAVWTRGANSVIVRNPEFKKLEQTLWMSFLPAFSSEESVSNLLEPAYCLSQILPGRKCGIIASYEIHQFVTTSDGTEFLGIDSLCEKCFVNHYEAFWEMLDFYESISHGVMGGHIRRHYRCIELEQVVPFRTHSHIDFAQVVPTFDSHYLRTADVPHFD